MCGAVATAITGFQSASVVGQEVFVAVTYTCNNPLVRNVTVLVSSPSGTASGEQAAVCDAASQAATITATPASGGVTFLTGQSAQVSAQLVDAAGQTVGSPYTQTLTLA